MKSQQHVRRWKERTLNLLAQANYKKKNRGNVKDYFAAAFQFTFASPELEITASLNSCEF